MRSSNDQLENRADLPNAQPEQDAPKTWEDLWRTLENDDSQSSARQDAWDRAVREAKDGTPREFIERHRLQGQGE